MPIQDFSSAMSYLAFSATPGYVSAHCSWTTCPALYCKCSELGTLFFSPHCRTGSLEVFIRSDRYNVEPFFFSSSINWIPSRYQVGISSSLIFPMPPDFGSLQEHPLPKIGDRVYTNSSVRNTLHEEPDRYHRHPYFHSHEDNGRRPKEHMSTDRSADGIFRATEIYVIGVFMVACANRRDQAYRCTCAHGPAILYGVPLCHYICPLTSPLGKQIIYPDFLGLHMVRNVEGSTIISYHHDVDVSTTSASDLYTRMKLMGRSVYW